MTDDPDAGLRREELADDPADQFRTWFREAREIEGLELPDACCLATVDEEGYPDARMVLLKDLDEGGFVFYTNLRSRKVDALRKRPRAALVFHWKPLTRQVRVRGDVRPVSEDEADAYFATRPRGSQIGAWASKQSHPVESRKALDRRFREAKERFRGREVPRPHFWSGFRIRPVSVEFWQQCDNRMHDRFRYTRTREGWELFRLQP